jgi:integrase/recombinase XerD
MKATQIEILIERYRQQLEILNFSPRTVTGRLVHLRRFAGFLQQQNITEVATITSGTLADHQRDLFYLPTSRGTARSVSYQNQAMHALRSFFRFLKTEGYVAQDAAESLPLARTPQTLPRQVLTPEEARKVIETPDTSCLLGYRDRTILETLYATGIRKSELMNLTVNDVNLEDEVLRINGGKFNKDRVVPLTRLACSFLETYLKAIRPALLQGPGGRHASASDRVFISQRAAPLSKNALGELVEKYARLAGVNKHVTCHIWRHSCATHLVKNKANLRHVQELLGHRDLSTTERYLHLTIGDLKEAHRKCHPREKQADHL